MEQNNKGVQDVFEKTHALAHALLDSDIYQAMKAAEEAAMADPEAGQCMTEYLEHKSALEEMLAQENPDSAKLNEHSTAMDEIQKRMQEIPSVANMSNARNEFSNLIAQVNQIISFVITGEMGGCDCGDEGCSGSCSSCGGGCGHVH
jgi:cell fate (sporulation/competence/biofilm development) regulator YlbF (YheA/YmcA/DUF963 family)